MCLHIYTHRYTPCAAPAPSFPECYAQTYSNASRRGTARLLNGFQITRVYLTLSHTHEKVGALNALRQSHEPSIAAFPKLRDSVRAGELVVGLDRAAAVQELLVGLEEPLGRLALGHAALHDRVAVDRGRKVGGAPVG